MLLLPNEIETIELGLKHPHLLKAKDIEFLESINERRYLWSKRNSEPSPAERDWLRDIAKRLHAVEEQIVTHLDNEQVCALRSNLAALRESLGESKNQQQSRASA